MMRGEGFVHKLTGSPPAGRWRNETPAENPNRRRCELGAHRGAGQAHKRFRAKTASNRLWYRSAGKILPAPQKRNEK